MTVLTCSRCKLEKPPSEFNKDKSRKSGYYPICKECYHKEQKEFRERNRERLLEKSRQYYIDNKEKEQERNKKYYQNNIEEVRKRKKIYTDTHKDQKKEYDKKYNDTPRIRLKNTYRGILKRCYNPKVNGYKYYGGRGIKCLWNTFEEFYNDMYESFMEQSNKYGTTDRKYVQLDRIDCDGDYCKENCRWVTSSENNYNKRK